MLATLLALTGCEHPVDPLVRPTTIEATYRLLYNDSLVGSSLFVLSIDAAGGYRLDAFTTPAGKMQREQAHEVLETSLGEIDATSVRPALFEESVMHDGDMQIARVRFDWAERALTVDGPEGSRRVALLPGTQDRLSYLLAASRLAAAGAGTHLLQVASAAASEENRLEIEGHEPVTLPLGHFDAVRISRLTPDEQETRTLWFSPDMGPLPLRALQLRDGNSVEMRLEDFTRRPSDPR
ncbi:MAG: DUF3108 domain-containing protein [Chromatiaceae bacterium]|nr:DUF3108 domain-containing protein [Gammaproteobacteria bacterium]MCP5300953.1 DUF3108 domain-containing protein [Chromatiaceae bacterium]MCP5421574.1 DUF3108 domain-containing protein [Chromatiaceae bacterium]